MLVESVQQLESARQDSRIDVQGAENLTRPAVDILLALRIRGLTRRLGHEPGQTTAIRSDQPGDLITIGGYPPFLESLQPGHDPGLDRIHQRSIEIEDPCGWLNHIFNYQTVVCPRPQPAAGSVSWCSRRGASGRWALRQPRAADGDAIRSKARCYRPGRPCRPAAQAGRWRRRRPTCAR